MNSAFRLVLSCLFLLPVSVHALPVVSNGYSVELYAAGVGAVTGLTMDGNGTLYAADYAGGRVLEVTGQNTFNTYASGISYVTDLAITDNGRLFASSSSSSNSSVVEIYSDGSTSNYVSGFSYPTSIESLGNELFVSNSGNGTISRIDQFGASSTFLSGFSTPNGPFGISLDESGNLYFVDHGTGGVYSSDMSGNTTLLGSVSSFGGTFTGIGFNDDLLVSDVNIGSLLLLNDQGSFDVFASGFAAKTNQPAIGPNDFIFDGLDNLYVGDGDNIWKISSLSVPEPATFALMVLGLGMISFMRIKSL